MAKKFDKISPKDISEEKFNQLVDALPSSVIEQPKPFTPNVEKKEKVDKGKGKKSKKKKISPKENTEEIPKVSKSVPIKDVNHENPTSESSETEGSDEVFVYECDGILFGVPVAYVTEITNDYGIYHHLKVF